MIEEKGTTGGGGGVGMRRCIRGLGREERLGRRGERLSPAPSRWQNLVADLGFAFGERKGGMGSRKKY